MFGLFRVHGNGCTYQYENVIFVFDCFNKFERAIKSSFTNITDNMIINLIDGENVILRDNGGYYCELCIWELPPVEDYL